MTAPIYLDYHATTPLDPRVLEAMMPYLTSRFGNAASASHAYGWEAEEAVKLAREQVADVIGATPAEIVWTSGATESINLALKGVAGLYEGQPCHVVTLTTEHAATLDTCRYLESRGVALTLVSVDRLGKADPAAVEAALRPDTRILSVLHGNNEIGTLQPLQALGALAKARGVLFHVDGAQALGKVPLDVAAMGIDLLSLSAHKVYGPKGVGALYVRRRGPRVRLAAQLHGGGHERGMRSGTLNVPGIVGFGAAAALAQTLMPEEAPRVAGLRNHLWETLSASLGGLTRHGDPHDGLAGNLNIALPGIDGEALMGAVPGLAVSTGSACTSASLSPSHVLAAIGVRDPFSKGSLRFGLGRFTTREEVDRAATLVIEAVRRLRASAGSPVPGP